MSHHWQARLRYMTARSVRLCVCVCVCFRELSRMGKSHSTSARKKSQTRKETRHKLRVLSLCLRHERVQAAYCTVSFRLHHQRHALASDVSDISIILFKKKKAGERKTCSCRADADGCCVSHFSFSFWTGRKCWKFKHLGLDRLQLETLSRLSVSSVCCPTG